MSDEQIIFLISQPRSGSTLLQAILGSHPDIYTCTEPWLALPFIYALKEEGSEFECNGKWMKFAINAFFEESGIDDEFYYSALNSFLTVLYHKTLSNSGKRFFLDKTPRYYEIASDLINIFPDAKFIILFRHPLAVLNSIIKTWVKKDIDILFCYSRDLLIAPTKLTNFVSAHHKNICLVKYETLVSSPKTEIKRICEYLDIEYIEEIINYKSNTDWFFGDKNFKDMKVPDDKLIDSWKDQLVDKRIVNFNHYYLRELGEEMFESLGYEFSSAFDHVNKFNPNEYDFQTWKTLLHDYHIVSLDEQRFRVRKKIQSNFLKTLYKKLMS